jgi:hypothetical protein
MDNLVKSFKRSPRASRGRPGRQRVHHEGLCADGPRQGRVCRAVRRMPLEQAAPGGRCAAKWRRDAVVSRLGHAPGLQGRQLPVQRQALLALAHQDERVPRARDQRDGRTHLG